MCDPVTATMAASTLMSVYGTFSQAQSQASALKANANAEQEQGYENENDARYQGRIKLADQLAALSDRGVSVSSGTPLTLLQQSAKNQELDALRLRADGINKANSLRYQASSILDAAPITAGAQLLMGSSKLAELGAFNSSSSPTPTPPPFNPFADAGQSVGPF